MNVERRPDLFDAPPAETVVADARRALKALAMRIAAEQYQLVFLRAAGEQRIRPCLAGTGTRTAADRAAAAAPAMTVFTRLPRRCIDALGEHTHPFWLGPDAPAGIFEICGEQVHLAGEERGLILPLTTERRQSGAVAFVGPRLSLDGPTLLDVHCACQTAFASLAGLDGAGADSEPPPVSKRELQCLKLTANGLTSEEIAREIGLSVHTTNQYLGSVAQKLDAVNRVHAVSKALRVGLID